MKKNEQGDEWTSVTFHTTEILYEKQLKADNFSVELEVRRGLVLKGQASMMEVLDVPMSLKKQVELKLINQQIFDLLQAI